MVLVYTLPPVSGQDKKEVIQIQQLSKPAIIKPVPSVNHQGVALVATLDLFGQVVLTVGLFYIGSGLFQVIYSSIIVFAAIFNRITLFFLYIQVCFFEGKCLFNPGLLFSR
jgi:hypothetical protein